MKPPSLLPLLHCYCMCGWRWVPSDGRCCGCAQAEVLKSKAEERARSGVATDANVVTVDDVHEAVDDFKKNAKKARY